MNCQLSQFSGLWQTQTVVWLSVLSCLHTPLFYWEHPPSKPTLLHYMGLGINPCLVCVGPMGSCMSSFNLLVLWLVPFVYSLIYSIIQSPKCRWRWVYPQKWYSEMVLRHSSYVIIRGKLISLDGNLRAHKDYCGLDSHVSLLP